MILLIDNYDSFVHNLARYLRQLGQTTHVVRNDAVSVADVRAMNPAAIVLSPGPCRPRQAGICLDLVRQMHLNTPMLGICLGHQAIAEALGGRVVRAEEPVHGRASSIYHENSGAFVELPSPLSVGRYHSLVVRDLPSCFRIDAWLEDGTPMAISHVDLPLVGWQFHPESILTDCGYELLTVFFRTAGLAVMNRPAGTKNAPEKNNLQLDWFRKTIEYPK